MIDIKNLTMRQIRFDDIATKLALGNPAYIPLKTFLKKNAFDFHQHNIAKTFVLVDNKTFPSPIWGYITLMCSEIVLNEGQRPQESAATSKYEAFPAVKIARLAIDKTL